MKIILKTWITLEGVRVYEIVTVDKGVTKSKRLDKDIFDAIVKLNKSLCNGSNMVG